MVTVALCFNVIINSFRRQAPADLSYTLEDIVGNLGIV